MVRPIAFALALAAGADHALAQANRLPRREFLSAAEVGQVVRQAVAEADARGEPATIAVTDRVGNVLAVYRMTGADPTVRVESGRGDLPPPSGLAGVELPIDVAAAIAKAITAAYLSSSGNAFGTRTASAIVQENFLPGSEGLEGGPLFGVQFSQLPCSDLSVRFASNNGGTIDRRIGPKRSPLGFSADSGGLALYENGTLVGGIGAIADGIYNADADVRDRDRNIDELIALAGTVGFDAPVNLVAERVTVDGRTLRYSDARTGDLRTEPADADDVDLAAAGAFVPVRGYYAGGGPRAGQAFGFGASGIRRAPPGLFDNDRAFMLATARGVNRFPPRAGTDAPATGALTEAEVTEILSQALGVALSLRGQIRRPLGSHAEVTISVVDTTGAILGVVRTPDAPIFGTDVSLQKARSAMFFSNPAAPADLARVRRPPAVGGRELGRRPGAYVNDLRAFAGANAIGGDVAYSNRSIGNLSRPFFPDGQNGNPNGPLSVPFERWSPFYTGLQFDLVGGNIVEHVGFILGGSTDTAPQCAGLPRLANGLQIFPGGMPIYRDGVLVGGIGISGDGIDQDDTTAFLGLDRASRTLDTGLGNAPRARRADRLTPFGANLRYVQCPYAPFLGSDQQNICEGL